MKEAKNQSAVVSKNNLICVLLLILSVIFFFLTSFFNMRAQSARDDRFVLTFNAIRFAQGSANLTNEVRAYAATADEAHFDAYWYEINTAKNRDIGLENMRAVGITQEEEQMIAEMSNLSNGLVPLEEAAMKDVKEGRRAEAVEYVYGPAYADVVRSIHATNARFRDSLDKRSSARVDMFNRMSIVLNVAMGILILAVVIMQLRNMAYIKRALISPVLRIREQMLRISRGDISAPADEMEEDTSEIGSLVAALRTTRRELRRYVGDISDKLSMMARGDMTAHIDIEYIGDFAPIKTSLTNILDSLNEMIGDMSKSVATASDAITSSAELVAHGAEALAESSSSQTKVVEELGVSVHDLSQKMKGIASSAALSNEKTASAASGLTSSTSQMGEMKVAMEQINTASEGIKKITETIANIGARTNIVAINAAIEASKAGDLGKGFSVVANEVRNLAIMCGNASAQTDKLLEDTLKAVEKATGLAESAQESLASLRAAADESAHSVSEIADCSREQAASLADVNKGFDQITSLATETAATAKESARSADALKAQADKLEHIRTLVQAFSLRK